VRDPINPVVNPIPRLYSRRIRATVFTSYHNKYVHLDLIKRNRIATNTSTNLNNLTCRKVKSARCYHIHRLFCKRFDSLVRVCYITLVSFLLFCMSVFHLSHLLYAALHTFAVYLVRFVVETRLRNYFYL
jgi:hypothetical protein